MDTNTDAVFQFSVYVQFHIYATQIQNTVKQTERASVPAFLFRNDQIQGKYLPINAS